MATQEAWDKYVDHLWKPFNDEWDKYRDSQREESGQLVNPTHHELKLAALAIGHQNKLTLEQTTDLFLGYVHRHWSGNTSKVYPFMNTKHERYLAYGDDQRQWLLKSDEPIPDGAEVLSQLSISHGVVMPTPAQILCIIRNENEAFTQADHWGLVRDGYYSNLRRFIYEVEQSPINEKYKKKLIKKLKPEENWLAGCQICNRRRITPWIVAIGFGMLFLSQYFFF